MGPGFSLDGRFDRKWLANKTEIVLPTRILIVDDHWVVIEGLKVVLRNHPESKVVGEAFDGVQAVKQVTSLRPDIVIMDICMPHMNGIEATRQIKRLAPEIRIIVFTMYSDKEYVTELLKAGISGYVLKEIPLSGLILAMNAVRQGGTYFNTISTILLTHMQQLDKTRSDKNSFERLSMREREVLKLLADGKSIKEIASKLCISPKTVESHKYNTMEKLDVRTIAGLTKIAVKKKLTQL